MVYLHKVFYTLKLEGKSYDCSRDPDSRIFNSITSCIQANDEDTLVLIPYPLSQSVQDGSPSGQWVITDTSGSKTYGGPYKLYRNGQLVTSNIEIGNDIETLDLVD